MANTVTRVYDNFAAAENALNALLHSGFSKDEVELTAREDESGGMQGNFVSGDGSTNRDRKHRGGVSDVFRSSSGNDDSSYERDFAPKQAQYGNSYVLTVDSGDDEQLHRASDIMDQFGAIDVDKLTARHRGAHS